MVGGRTGTGCPTSSASTGSSRPRSGWRFAEALEAARDGGAVTIGVAAGSYGAAELREAGAVAVFDDLSDTGTVLAAITGAIDGRPPSGRKVATEL